jgi:hypothetical protein
MKFCMGAHLAPAGFACQPAMMVFTIYQQNPMKCDSENGGAALGHSSGLCSFQNGISYSVRKAQKVPC